MLWNPFDDIVPRVLKDDVSAKPADLPKQTKEEAEQAKRGRKRATGLLSFGEEEEAIEMERQAEGGQFKMVSAHHALDDESLLQVQRNLGHCDLGNR